MRTPVHELLRDETQRNGRAQGLFPQQDTGSLGGVSDGPQDISFPAMRERQEAVNAIIQRHPAVAHFTSFLGGGPLNTGNFFIEL